MKLTLIKSLGYRLKFKYYDIWPHEYRISQLWYKIKCFCWHRYTTYKPRYLGHAWHDKTCILPHLMFEVLSKFIENECSPGIVDWEASEHTIIVQGVKRNVRSEMQALYDWWHEKYNKAYPKIHDEWWVKIRDIGYPKEDMPPVKNQDGKIVYYEWNTIFRDDEHKTRYYFCLDSLNRMDYTIQEELTEKMHRLVNLMPYLWT